MSDREREAAALRKEIKVRALKRGLTIQDLYEYPFNSKEQRDLAWAALGTENPQEGRRLWDRVLSLM